MRTTTFLAAAAVTLLALPSCSPGGRAIDAIENDLVADDSTVRAKAAAELTNRFPEGAIAVPMLIDLLDDESPDVVAAAARSIDSMALDAAPVLTAFCADRANFDERETTWKERNFRRRMEGLISLVLRNPRDAFGSFDSTPPEPLPPDCGALAALAPMDYPPHLRWWRFGAMNAFGRSSGDTRTMTAAALAMFGEDAIAERRIAAPDDPRRGPAVLALVPLLKSDVAVQAYCGARIAQRIRGGGPGIVAALAETLSAPKTTPASWKERSIRIVPGAAADALAAIGPAAASAAPQLTAVAGDPRFQADTRETRELLACCVRALVRVGRETDLRPLFDGDAPNALFLARAAAEAGCAPDLVLDRLIASAKRPDAPSDAFAGLAALGPAAATALPLARERLRIAEDDDQRVARAETNLSIAADDDAAIAVLDETLKDWCSGYDEHGADGRAGWAWYILCRRAAPTPTVLRRLTVGVTKGTMAMDWPPAAEALGRAGPAAKDAIPALVSVATREIQDRGWRVPDHLATAVIALGRIGPDAAAAAPALTAMRDKGDETIRVAAAQALRRIRAKK